jgi:hypothetical protein
MFVTLPPLLLPHHTALSHGAQFFETVIDADARLEELFVWLIVAGIGLIVSSLIQVRV